MRLLYIYRYLILGGVTTQLVNRLRYLQERAEVHFAYLKDYGGRSAFGAYPHVHLFESVQALSQYLKQEAFDLVVVIDTVEAYQALEEAEYRGRVVHEVHTTTKQAAYLKQLSLDQIDALLVPSQYVADQLKAIWPGLNKPCHVTPNCLDTALFAPVALDPWAESVLDRTIILWVGKLDEHKNWPLFLDVAEQLTQMGFEGQFWMVGGETAKPHTVQHLLNEAKRKGVLRRLYWIPRLEYERMPLVYTLTQASGGISLSTSRNESFGMTVLESLACSCPPLAPNVGALGEVLDGELAACLYEPSGAGEIARKVIQLLEDSALRERLVSVGKAKIEQHYTIDSAASLYYQTLLQIIH